MRYLALIILFNLTAFSLGAQSVSLRLTDIKDVRSSNDYNRKLILKLSVLGIDVDEQRRIKIEEIAPLTDDTGRAMRQEENTIFEKGFSEETNIELALSSPSRKARSIPEIKGMLSYLNPTLENKGLIVVTEPLNHYQEDLLAGAYTDTHLYWVNPEVADSLAGKRNDELITAAMELNKRGVLSDKLVGAGNSSGTGISSVLVTIANGIWPSKYRQNEMGAHLVASDPQQRIISISITDANGEEMIFNNSKMNNHYEFSFQQPIQNDWTISVVMKNEQSVRKIPFTLKDVKLP